VFNWLNIFYRKCTYECYRKAFGIALVFAIRTGDFSKQVKPGGVVSGWKDGHPQERLRLPDPFKVELPIPIMNSDAHMPGPGR
jgi:hypothetical protein